MDYQKFRKDYLASGKTQKAYGEELSISSSMVHYYLRRAKELENNGNNSTNFSELKVQEEVRQETNIITASGIQIVIPV